VLTGHGDDETRRRALRTGAVAFLEKPFEGEELLEAVDGATSALGGAVRPTLSTVEHRTRAEAKAPPNGSDRPIELAGATLDGELHVCAFFNGPEEEHRVLRSFVKDGLDRGEKSVHIVGPDERDDYVQWLRDEGIDVEQALSSGQLEVRLWEETYLSADGFDMEKMLAGVDEALRANAASQPPTRVVAHMEWALLAKPGVEDLIEYEARADEKLRNFRGPLICAYDLTKFSASVVMDVLRTHRTVIIGGVLQENPFFVPPEQFLLEIQARQAGRDVTIAS
jgi:hypothetical protein